ncbi:MAG TPA: dihydrofolate reductase family protein [Actinomycetota bacterium]
MSKRPYVLLSCAASIDGYIDDTRDARLMLSNDADFDRVDEVRAGCDAILVGSVTIRKDNPRLLVRSEKRRNERLARGLTPTPTKVTITGRGDLDPATQFFVAGDTEKIVYAASSALDKTRERVSSRATVVDGSDPIDLLRVLNDLATRGIGRLMVEGGGTMHTQFLTNGLADELHLVIAPFFVGDSRAPRFVHDGAFPWDRYHRARLAEVTPIGDVVLLRYALSERFEG